MFLDVRQDLFLMVYLTFKYNVITYMCLIPFEVPCESKTQDCKRFKIGIYLKIREKIITAWKDLGNPNFLTLFTSVIMCNCDESVITKSPM